MCNSAQPIIQELINENPFKLRGIFLSSSILSSHERYFIPAPSK